VEKNQLTQRNLITGTIYSVSGLQNEVYEHTNITPVLYIRFQQREVRMIECWLAQVLILKALCHKTLKSMNTKDILRITCW